MSTKEQARKAMVESRQHEEHVHENMLLRSQEEIEHSSSSELEEESRELIVEQRQQDKHTQETMLSRSEEEMGNTDT